MRLVISDSLTPLQFDVWTELQDLAEGYDSLDELRSDLSYGCSSGLVPSLVYYEDTLLFFEKHKEAINLLLAEHLSEFGLPMHKLLKDWNDGDPLVLGTNNRNLLAWYAFECVAEDLLDRAKVDKGIA